MFPSLRFTRKQVVLFIIGVLVLAILSIVYRQVDMEHLHNKAEELNGPSVFTGVTLLPLAGFPVSVLHAVAGVRFGLAWGLPLVAASILIQLLLSYGLVKLMPNFFQRRFAKLQRRLPQTAHGPLTLFTMLVPGMPYFAQIYVLPMMGVPLRIFLLYSFPINVARSLIGVSFGDMSDHLTPLKLVGFALYTIGVTAACAWAFRRLRMKLKDPPTAADDPKRPG